MKRLPLAALVLLPIALAGCAPQPHHVADPILEPTGAETLPTWVRHPETATATLTIPADLLFATDSAELSSGAVTVLQHVLDEARPPTAHTLVEGYADSDGDAAHNQALSERRAEAVAQWLIAHGVSPTSITTRGWGETRPAVEETDGTAKAQNRRVVVTVTNPTSNTQGEQR